MLKNYLQLVGIRWDIASLLKIYLQLVAIKFVAKEIDLVAIRGGLRIEK
jgi:hypothetical protein